MTPKYFGILQDWLLELYSETSCSSTETISVIFQSNFELLMIEFLSLKSSLIKNIMKIIKDKDIVYFLSFVDMAIPLGISNSLIAYDMISEIGTNNGMIYLGCLFWITNVKTKYGMIIHKKRNALYLFFEKNSINIPIVKTINPKGVIISFHNATG